MFVELRASSSGMGWVWQPGRSSSAREGMHEPEGSRVHRTLKRIAKARASLDSQEAAALRDAHRIRLWEQFGYTSLVDYMERELGYTARSAVDRLRLANLLVELPKVEAALDQGALSFSGARTLAPVLTPATEQAWLDKTQDMNVREIEALVSGHKPGDLPDDPVDPSARTKVLRFDVKLDTAELVRDYQKKRARELGSLIDDDALIRELVTQALDRLVEERSEKASARPRHQIALTVCDQCKRGWLNAAGTMTLVPPAQLAAAQCDADVIGRVDIDGVPRKQASIPPAVKRKVLARDGHRCRVPGCRSTNIDVHHLHPQSLGGSHDEWNLIVLCEAHHNAVHEGTVVIVGRAPDVTVTFTAANRFALESRVVETRRALERRGITRAAAREAVAAVRTHVGGQALSKDDWLKLALDHCQRAGGS